MYCRRRRSVSCVVQPLPRQNRQMPGWALHSGIITLSFLPASTESTRVRVLSKGLNPLLPCWLYCSALCCSKRNAELLSEALTQDSTAWAIFPSSHAPCGILGKALHVFGFILYCDYLHLLSLHKSWPRTKQTWPLWLLLPHSMHSTKLAVHQNPPKWQSSPWINPLTIPLLNIYASSWVDHSIPAGEAFTM